MTVLTVSSCFFLFLPVSFSIIQFLPVFGVFFFQLFCFSPVLPVSYRFLSVSSSLFLKFSRSDVFGRVRPWLFQCWIGSTFGAQSEIIFQLGVFAAVDCKRLSEA